jgi:hypothetical protein
MIKLAIIASSYGIPVATLLDKLRDVLKMTCLECQAATGILKKLNDLGPKQTELLIKQVLNK